MSEESNHENASKIESDDEHTDDLNAISKTDNNGGSAAQSATCVVDTKSNPMETESAISKTDNNDDTATQSAACVVDTKPSPMETESAANSSIQMSQQSEAESTAKSSSNPMSQQSKNNSISSSGNNQTDSSANETSESKIHSSDRTGSSYDTGSEETYSSKGFNRFEIEESVLDMIRHIEEEIEAEEHDRSDQFQDIEIKIKTSRVMVAIEQMIEKLEIAFCLPYILVENIHEMNSLCGDSFVSKLMNEYCKVRDEDIDVCRFQPTVINCINDAYEVELSQFVELHHNKVGFLLQLITLCRFL